MPNVNNGTQATPNVHRFIHRSINIFLVDDFFKMICEFKTLLTSKRMEINLGGHAFPQHIKDEDHRTQFGIVHMQSMC